MDHVCNKNPVTDRDNVKVIDRESDKTGRLMREAIWIWNSKNVKQDDESYQLSQVWDMLLTPETELSPDEDLWLEVKISINTYVIFLVIKR